MNNPDNIRPPFVLNLTTKYLMTIVLDQDLVPPGQSYFQYQNQSFGEIADTSNSTQSFMSIYSFMKDRTRQLTQDINIANLPPSLDTI